MSHAGVDATAQQTVPAALADAAIGAAGGGLLQYIVVSVDQDAPFTLLDTDLYPQPDRSSGDGDGDGDSDGDGVGVGDSDDDSDPRMFWRSAADGGKPCVSGSDAVASGCVTPSATPSATGASLFDVTTAGHRCSQAPSASTGPNCLHAVGVWQVWPVGTNASLVVLGDLSAYVSLSGYRFRLPSADAVGARAGARKGPRAAARVAGDTAADAATGAAGDTSADRRDKAAIVPGATLVVVGMPGEKVNVTYLRKKKSEVGGTGRWIVHVQEVVVGEDGRTTATLA